MTTPASCLIVQRLWKTCNVLRDESQEDSANLPGPDVMAAEIVEDLQAAVSIFEGIAEELRETKE